MEGFSLIVPFIDESESYCLGFEAGLVWADLVNKDYAVRTVHRANMKQFESIAKHFKVDLNIVPTLEYEWVDITFSPAKPSLRLVN